MAVGRSNLEHPDGGEPIRTPFPTKWRKLPEIEGLERVSQQLTFGAKDFPARDASTSCQRAHAGRANLTVTDLDWQTV